MNCQGYGYVICTCGGDMCVCEMNGEIECFGCDDCNPSVGDVDLERDLENGGG